MTYYIVEVRLPVQISEAKSIDDAANQARKKIEKEYGVYISNWFLRVFEYNEDNVHPCEYVGSPGGTFMKIDNNIIKHKDILNGRENKL